MKKRTRATRETSDSDEEQPAFLDKLATEETVIIFIPNYNLIFFLFFCHLLFKRYRLNLNFSNFLKETIIV